MHSSPAPALHALLRSGAPIETWRRRSTRAACLLGLALAGVSHTDEFNKTNGGRWGRVVMAWLRWRLVGDEGFAKFFRGPDCPFCTGDWKAQKRNID